MSVNPDSYYNLAERIEEADQLQQDYPIIEKLLDGGGAISLTADEHEALSRYLNLTRQMEDIERQKIYFRGHTDCFAYLKKIGAI